MGKKDAKVGHFAEGKVFVDCLFYMGNCTGNNNEYIYWKHKWKNEYYKYIKLPIKSFGQFWFVYDLFWIFLIYYVATNFFKLNLKSIFVISAILSVVSPMIHFWQVGRILYYLPFFMMGIVIATLQFDINKLNTVALIVIFLLLNAAYFLLNMGLVLNSILETITAVIGIAMIINILSKFNSGWLAYIGKNSMAIYLMHIMATAGVRIFMMKLGINSIVLHLIFGTLLGVIAPLIALKVFSILKIDKYIV